MNSARKLTFFVLFISLAVYSFAQNTCFDDASKCEADECCVAIGGSGTVIGRCKKLLEEEKTCEMKPVTIFQKKHVYLHMCPCAESLKCEVKGGIIGKLAGKCRPVSEETIDGGGDE